MTESISFTVKKKPLAAALMLIMFLAAMETTITVLAMPTIAEDLAGFDLINLIFSSYLFTAAITTPVFGRLADSWGRKKVLIWGIIIFLVGSVLCGMSQSMLMLIVFRALQGIGAGSIFTLTYTIIGDTFPLETRGAMMGAMSAVWGIAGLVGPLLGGLLIDTLSWHWVFFINIPFGLLSIILLNSSLKESRAQGARSGKKVDRSGLLTRMTILVNIVALLACVSMVGIDVYAALFLQTVLGYSPTIAGLATLPMALTWFIVSSSMGKLLLRFNAKLVVVVSGLVQLVSGLIFVSLNEHSSIIVVIIGIALAGVGLGGLLTATTIMIQESVGYSKRGTAMGINSFVKSMGQTVGITVLGIVFNLKLDDFLTAHGFIGVDTSTLLQLKSGKTAEAVADVAASATRGLDSISENSTEITSSLITSALDNGIDFLFWVLFICTVIMVLISLFIPAVRLGSDQPDEQEG